MEFVSLKSLPIEARIQILRELGYDSDGKFVLDSSKQKLKDRYLGIDVRVSNMVILPGSSIVLDDNPLSVASYMEDNPDVF